MSTRPEETEAHSLDGLGGLGWEEPEVGRTLPAFSVHPPIRNGGRSQAGVSAQTGPFPGKEMSAMGRRAFLRVSSPVR